MVWGSGRAGKGNGLAAGTPLPEDGFGRLEASHSPSSGCVGSFTVGESLMEAKKKVLPTPWVGGSLSKLAQRPGANSSDGAVLRSWPPPV